MRCLIPVLLPQRMPDHRASARSVARWRNAVRTGLLALLALLTLLALLPLPAAAQGVDLNTLKLMRRDNELVLEYSARLSLNPAVEDALHRGIPLYFQASATLLRKRWYWRDDRIARVRRTWRVAYQPLTASWRVSLGGLSQVYGSLTEALAPMSRVSGWAVTEIDKLENGERYYVEFSFRLDNSQLPPPLQIDVSNDYKLGVERTQPLE